MDGPQRLTLPSPRPFDPQVGVHLDRPARLVVSGPGGAAHELWPDPDSTTVGELARIVGLDPAAGVTIDGVLVDPSISLVRSRVRTGSRVAGGDGPHPTDAPPTAGGLQTVVQVAGPAVGPPVGLGPGRHLVGRAPGAAVRLADPHVEPHHAVLDVGADGTTAILQLAGRVPIIVGGVPLDGRTVVPHRETIEIGASRLLVIAPHPAHNAVATGVPPGDPWRRSVVRGPRRTTDEPVAVVTPPAPAPEPAIGGWGMTGAVVTLVGSITLAVVVRQPVLALLGVVGAAAAWATSATGRARDARARRRGRRRDDEACARFATDLGAIAARLRDTVVDEAVRSSLLLGDPASSDLWSRRIADADALRVMLGWGSFRTSIPVGVELDELRPDLRPIFEAASHVCDAPVEIDLASEQTAPLAIVGDDASAVARSLVVRLAVQCGPADWRLVVVTDDVERFAWAEWLPHASIGPGTTAILDHDDPRALADALERLDADARRTVVLTDVPALLATRTSALRRFLGAGRPVTTIAIVDRGEAVPAYCRSVLEIGSRSRARWNQHAAGSLGSERLHVAGLAEEVASTIARRLAGLTDPEDPAGVGTELPTDVRLEDLPLPRTAVEIAAAWRAGGDDPAPAAPIGVTLDGVVEVDLVRDGPHALIAGTTGSGKSEALRTLVVAIASCVGPDHVTFVLVDYKGGATFDACADLPHTVGLVTDLDEGLAARALVSLEAEVHRRERLLRQSGSTDLAGHRAAVGSSPLPRLVVVIDEFAALAADLPDFIPALVGIAQRGRSLGVHLVLATQRPAGVVDDHIRANTNLRLALRLHDRADALDVVGDPSPASLPRGVAGRAVMRLGPGDMAEFQIARCTAPIDNAADPARTELEALVEEVRRASTIVDVGAPHRPWLASLPRELREVDAPDAVGVVDEPALQRRSPLRWDRARGNLALVGALGSGTTTALRTVVMVATSLDPPRRLHVYVVDARGDAALTALAGPHCSGVIRLHETERVDRLLHRLATDLEHRRAGAAADRGPDIVVAIDGLIALRETLDHVDRGPSLAALDRVLADGPAVGIATIAVIDAARGGSVLARFAQRWVFHLDDPADAPTLGVPSARVPPAVPGRLVVAASGLEAHVALIERDPHEGEGSPLPVEILAGVVPVNTLGRMSAPVGPVVALPVGLDFVTLATAALNVPIGEHVLIVGPARSGRSSALIRLIEAWREHHPGAGVTVICPTRSSPLVARYGAASGLDTLLLDNADPDGLIAVDDCERLDDPDGRLAHQLDRRAGAPTVLAAGRADALRVAYGHWTTICRRSRLGLVMAAGAELDGDVLGAVLPRRAPVPARPGLAWLVDGNGHSLVQVALDP